jgi:hypothetical protein
MTFFLFLFFRKLGITFEPPLDNETEEQTRKRCRRNSDKIRRKINNMNLAFENIPDPPPFTTDGSGGTTPGSMLFSLENILIGNLSFVHLSHMLFFNFMSILVSLQIEQE